MDKSDILIEQMLRTGEVSLEAYGSSCAMLALPMHLLDAVLQWNNENIPEDILYIDPEVEHVVGRELEPHITILYGLFTEDVRIVEEALSNCDPITFVLGKVGSFEQDKYDVIFVEVEPIGELLTAREKLLQLPHQLSFPDYNPHITLAYVKKGTASQFLKNEIFNGIAETSANVLFSTKSGGKMMITLGAESPIDNENYDVVQNTTWTRKDGSSFSQDLENGEEVGASSTGPRESKLNKLTILEMKELKVLRTAEVEKIIKDAVDAKLIKQPGIRGQGNELFITAKSDNDGLAISSILSAVTTVADANIVQVVVTATESMIDEVLEGTSAEEVLDQLING